MLPRFQGKVGKTELRSLLAQQKLLGGTTSAADRLLDFVKVEEYSKGKQVYHEGDEVERILFLVLGGSVELVRGSAKLVSFGGGQFFGEFPLLDPTAKYTVTVTATELAVIATAPWPAFAELANQEPAIWRNMSDELARRLRGTASTLTNSELAPKTVTEVFLQFLIPALKVAPQWLVVPAVLLAGTVYGVWSALPDSGKTTLLEKVGIGAPAASSASAPLRAPK